MSAIDNLESELTTKGFATADLLSAFVNPDGSQMDMAMRLSPEFDLKSELLSCLSKVLTKTDCAAFRDSRTVGHTSRFYNYHPEKFVGNFKIGPSHNRSKIGFHALLNGLTTLLGVMELGLAASFGGGFPHTWGMVYHWFFLGSEQSASLEIPVLTPEELRPASSRD